MCVCVFTRTTAATHIDFYFDASDPRCPVERLPRRIRACRFPQNQKESLKQRDSGAMVGTITILFLGLSLFRAATHGGITAQSGSATYSWSPTMQHSTSVQQLLLCRKRCQGTSTSSSSQRRGSKHLQTLAQKDDETEGCRNHQIHMNEMMMKYCSCAGFRMDSYVSYK